VAIGKGILEYELKNQPGAGGSQNSDRDLQASCSDADEIARATSAGQAAFSRYMELACGKADEKLLAQIPDSFANDWEITPDKNNVDALGLIKDWVSTLLGVETAAIGAIGAFLASDNMLHLSYWQKGTLVAAALFFGISIVVGGSVLYMLPACAQRKPIPSNKDKDIYSIVIVHEWWLGTGVKTDGWRRGNLSDHTNWFAKSFAIGIFAFFLFIIVTALKGFWIF
jgi:hypothetical protein